MRLLYRMTRRALLIPLTAWFVFTALATAAEPHWDLQFQYKQADFILTINDFAMPSAQRGVACGYASDHNGRQRPLVLLTTDGGAHWTESPAREIGLSLFFLDDSTGWMVTAKGVWQTLESGRTWTKKTRAPSDLVRVWFLTREHGYGSGTEKRVFETNDGGDTWTLLPIVKEVPSDAKTTTFGEISFNGKAGIIAGWSLPPRPELPLYAQPSQANAVHRQIPTYSVLLQTVDGGQTWKKSDASMFGQITRISMAAQGSALGLIEFRDEFEFPSEVYKVDLHTGKSDRVFRQRDSAITDVRLFSGLSTAVIAGYEASGPIYRGPIPGKLKVLISEDLETWSEMTVDYRAVAHRAMIAGPDPDHLWIATDTGMILRLVPE